MLVARSNVTRDCEFENLALELQYRVQRANDAARALQAQKERAARLFIGLRGLTGSDVDEITRELRQAEVGEDRLRTNIEERVKAVSQAARRRADRDYAGRVIREEFERLGYEVEEGFQTIFVSGGTINLRKADMKEYSARMRVNAAQERLDFHMVRAGKTSEPPSQERRTRDREVEDQWCGDLAQVMAAIKQKSVQSRITQRIPSGAQPVLVVDWREAPISGGKRMIDWRRGKREGEQVGDVSVAMAMGPATSLAEPEGLSWPRWLNELDRTLAVRPQFVISGNIRDVFLVPTREGPLLQPIVPCLFEALSRRGVEFLLVYDRVDGLRVFPDAAAASAAKRLNIQVGQQASRDALIKTMRRVTSARDVPPCALIIDYASRTVARPQICRRTSSSSLSHAKR